MPDFRTDTQKVTDMLREAILRGEFSPGTRLPQRTVAERFDTTTIVAREALRALTTEGLVIVEPRFGAMVQEISVERLEQRYVVREALEGMAARLAAKNRTASEAEALIELATECDRELPGEKLDRNEKASLHYKLHETIVGMTRCQELADHLSGLLLHSVIVSNAFHIDWLTDDRDAHVTVVSPIVQGDAAKAERAMRSHVKKGLAMELNAIQQGAAVQ